MSVTDGLRYEVIEPCDERYEAARAVWNGSIDHRPAAIARPRADVEVADALLRARDKGADVAVRGGGHSMQGHSMSDGGVTIDLSAINQVEVDAQGRRSRVGGGALLGDVARATGPHGLAIPCGHVSHTGVAGLTLGGGTGWIMRHYGLAIDRLVAARVVTAVRPRDHVAGAHGCRHHAAERAVSSGDRQAAGVSHWSPHPLPCAC
jgi:FAD/FMN-containing dehydrogenase